MKNKKAPATPEERTPVRQVLFGISGKDKISLMTVSCILGRMIYLALTDDAKFVFLFVEKTGQVYNKHTMKKT